MTVTVSDGRDYLLLPVTLCVCVFVEWRVIPEMIQETEKKERGKKGRLVMSK